jgi:hypothetical protein
MEYPVVMCFFTLKRVSPAAIEAELPGSLKVRYSVYGQPRGGVFCPKIISSVVFPGI